MRGRSPQARRRTQRPPGEVTHPESECGRGERDHPRGAAFERREDRDERQSQRERREQEPEEVPLHLPETVVAREARGYTQRGNSGA